MKEKVLIVEDNSEYMDLTQTWLQNSGYEVLTAEDGIEGMRKIFSSRPDLVLLDAKLPKMDGWEVCRRIREITDIPVIMLTACGQKTDRLKGFASGADDYLTKPIDFDELTARIRAILHRSQPANHEEKPSTFSHGEIEIDWGSHQVWVRGNRVKLSPIEYKVLSCLVKNRGWIVTHEQLLEKAWGPNYFGDKSLVKLYIRYLRQKIEKSPHNPEIILTERGTGYLFAMQNDLRSPGEKMIQEHPALVKLK